MSFSKETGISALDRQLEECLTELNKSDRALDVPLFPNSISVVIINILLKDSFYAEQYSTISAFLGGFSCNRQGHSACHRLCAQECQ
jgi:hypothetical protein